MVNRTVLAIDTSTAAVVTAVVRHGTDSTITPLAEAITVGVRAHAELLTPNVLSAVADAGVKMSELDAVVIGCGPGPFTGLRVGMASAVAYGQALGVPVHPVCSLDAIAAGTGGEVLVITDARRREVYWARYRDGVRVEGPQVCAPAAVAWQGAAAVAGSPEHCALFDLPRIGPAHPTPAGLVAAVADFGAQPAPPRALYLRRPDATTAAERAAR